MTTGWHGVFPAATTQFHEDLSVDIDATQRVLDALVNDGVNGLIVMGTCGENNSLDPEEKRTILKAAVEVVNGRVPVVTGVSEFDTRRAAAYARAAEMIGADGLIFQDLEDLEEAVREINPELRHFETSVFNGHYVTSDVDQGYLDHLNALRSDDNKAVREWQEGTSNLEIFNEGS